MIEKRAIVAHKFGNLVLPGKTGDTVVDQTDKKILNALSEDSDRSRKLIAREASLSEPSLSKKIATLQADRVIKKFSVEIDYEKTGYNTNSITLIRMKEQDKDKLTVLADTIAKMNEAVEVYTILGEWDIFVRWLCTSNSHVMEVVKRVLAEGSAGHTETITLGQEYKRERGPVFDA